jgi:hypothetical protein
MNSPLATQVPARIDKRAMEISRLFSKGYPNELPLRQSKGSIQFERAVGTPPWRSANGKCLIGMGAAYKDKTDAIVLKADAAFSIGLLVRDEITGEIKPGDLFREDHSTMALHDAFQEISAGDPFKGKRITQTTPDGTIRDFKLRPGVCIEGFNRELPLNFSPPAREGALPPDPENAAADRLSESAADDHHVEIPH